MNSQSRREFLAEVGRGMFVASVGSALACELGLASVAWAEEETRTLTFGKLEPLVTLMQETPTEKLLSVLVKRSQDGVELRQLVAAAALANARTFGGEHYFGFHSFMALAPAYQMALELPREQQLLPVLKVLHRNTYYIHSAGGHAREVLHPLPPGEPAKQPSVAEQLQREINRGDRVKAEQLLAALQQRSLEDAFNGLLPGVVDNHDVHSVVLPWRAWALLDLTGREHALTLLRQTVRKCAKDNNPSKADDPDLKRHRAIVPNLLEQYRLGRKALGTRKGEDRWVEKLSLTLLTAKPQEAAEAVAGALGEGFSPEDVGEAISLAANQLVLRQVENWEGNYGRRVHGDSMGVHGSDATNAWRNIVRVSNPRNQAAGLIIAAMDIANHVRAALNRDKKGLQNEPFPLREHLEKIKSDQAEALLRDLDGAIRENNQLAACALAQRYGERGYDVKPLFALCRRYAISEDGRLHGEKYYRTVVEEFATTRPAFRWRQMVALARVTASAYGYNQQDLREGHAPAYLEACRLLGIKQG